MKTIEVKPAAGRILAGIIIVIVNISSCYFLVKRLAPAHDYPTLESSFISAILYLIAGGTSIWILINIGEFISAMWNKLFSTKQKLETE